MGARPTMMLIALASTALLFGFGDGPAETEEAVEFEVDLREFSDVHDVGEPQLYLTVQTTQLFSCFSLHGEADVDQSGRVIAVHVGRPEAPPPGTGCATVLFPASFKKALELTSGGYTLDVVSADRHDYYDITISEAFVQITTRSATFSRQGLTNTFEPQLAIDPDSTRHYRFPRGSFAAVCGGLNGDEPFCERLFHRLSGMFKEFTLPADGNWPVPTAADGHYYNAPTHLYAYERPDSWGEARRILQEYIQKVDHTCGRSIYLVNWLNDREMSWLIRDTVCESPSAEPLMRATDTGPTQTVEAPSKEAKEAGSDWGKVAMAALVLIAVAAVVITVGAVRRRNH